MLNTVSLMGRLTADPELRYTGSNIPVTGFALAVERDYKSGDGEKQTDFINIVAWRNTAEFVSKWFRKGQLMAVTGSIQTRKYQDRDGNNRTAVEVVADHAYFAEGRRDTEGRQADNRTAAPAQSAGRSVSDYAPGWANASQQSFSDLPDIPADDDLPF